MRATQPRLLIQHDIHLDPHAIAGMIRRDGLIRVHDGGEAPGQECDLFQEVGGDGGAGEAGYVFDAGFGPVVDDEEGEEGGAEGVEPPEGEGVAEEGEEEGEGVEDYVGFAVWVGGLASGLGGISIVWERVEGGDRVRTLC